VRRIPIRVKVAATLALPLFALIVVSVFEVRQAAAEAAQVRQETQLAVAVTGPTGVITRLQDERTWASLELTDLTDTEGIPVRGYEETRGGTDAAIQEFRDEVASKGGAMEAVFRDALAALDELEEIRGDVDEFTDPRSIDNMPFSSSIYDRYTVLVGGLLDANARLTGRVDDAELRHGTELAVLALSQVETEANLSRQAATAAMMSPGGIDTHAEVTTVAYMQSIFDRANERLGAAREPYATVVRERYPRELVEQLHQIIDSAVATGTIQNIDALIDVVGIPPEESFPGLRDALTDEVVHRADTLNAQAATRQRMFTVLAVVAFAVAAAVAWLISQSIAGPLRSLSRQARDVSARRLPEAVTRILETPRGEDIRLATVEPLEVATRDEVAEVVQALNAVQDAALDLAVGQAVLRRNIGESFVSLGRRNQNLLGRQLDFITELQTRETDPDTLSGLFRLDHLATRMRRNAESLLVLAGIDTPRKWAAPVPVLDVIRASLGEVEDYQRVGIDHVEPAKIQGTVASDLGHLLAELVENALTFSPPSEQVLIGGQWHHGDSYRVAIIDQGLGMSMPALEDANARLAGAEASPMAASRYLGHHVAGRLAVRHGIRARLAAGPVQGTVAIVDVPLHLCDVPRDWENGSAPAPPPPPSMPAADPVPAIAAAASGPWAAAGPGLLPSPAAAPQRARALGPSPFPNPPSGPGPAMAPFPGPPPATAPVPAPAMAPFPAPFPAPAPAPVTGAAAADSLPRRVRGAQMPTLQPTPLRRSEPTPAAGVRGVRPVGNQNDPRGLGQTQADQVHSFLESFSAGVQRGLNEVQRRPDQGGA
jgi:signal transduction histidine kinase